MRGWEWEEDRDFYREIRFLFTAEEGADVPSSGCSGKEYITLILWLFVCRAILQECTFPGQAEVSWR